MIEVIAFVVIASICLFVGVLVAGVVALFRGSPKESRVAGLEGRVAEVTHRAAVLTRQMGEAGVAFSALAARVAYLEYKLTSAPVGLRAGAVIASQVTSPPPTEPEPEPAATPAAIAPPVVTAPHVTAPAPMEPAPIPAAPAPSPFTEHPRTEEDEAAPSPAIDWERWLGVRGAAALGAAVLVIAGIYFFRFAAERGVFTLPVRAILGALAGVASVAVAETVLRERYRVLSGWLSGAGIALLYITTWAAGPIYGLIGLFPSVAMLVAITASCVALSLVHGSLAIAVLGLFAGFFAPLSLSHPMDQPALVFTYLLVLDVGLLAVARRRGWWLLWALSFGVTAIYEIVWIVSSMGGSVWLGFGLVASFAALFGLAARPRTAEPTTGWPVPGQVPDVSLLGLFAFGVYLGLRSDPGIDLLSLAVIVALPSAGALVRTALGGGRGIAVAAAVASLAALSGWVIRNAAEATSVAIVAVIVALAAMFHASLLVQRWRGMEPSRGLFDAALIWALGGAMVLVLVSALAGSTWQSLVGIVILCALVRAQAGFAGRERLHVLPGVVLSLSVVISHAIHMDEATSSGAPVWLFVAVGTGLVLTFLSLVQRGDLARRSASHGAAAGALILLGEVALSSEPFTRASGPAPVLAMWIALVLGALATVAGIRTVNKAWIIGAMLAVSAVQTFWTLTQPSTPSALAASDSGPLTLLALISGAALFSIWPLLSRDGPGREVGAIRAAALSAPVFFPALAVAWSRTLPDVNMGALLIVLAGVAFAPAFVAVRRRGAPVEEERSSLVWPGAVALAFVVAAIPTLFGRAGTTMGFAALGLGLVALFRRVDHAGLKYTGLALLGFSALRLLDLDHHAAPADGDVPATLRLVVTYGVGASCLVGARRALSGVEVERQRGWEQGLFGRRAAASAGMLFAAVAVVFVGLTLVVSAAFGDGSTLEVSFDRSPARDLTLSAVWFGYALSLLGLGMRFGSTSLRWLSLLLLLVSSGKVFLHDLGQLRDLQRVASLGGLAVSLILVSVIYQRFVFKRTAKS